MERLSVRPFTEKDIDFALELDMMERWNDTKSDIKRMFSLEPNGYFVAEVHGERVGHVFSVNYGRLGWIGLLIVKAKYRRVGIGTLLTKMAMDYLLSHGVETIKLESVSEIASLYRKLGFVDECDSLRFIGVSGEKATFLPTHYVNSLKKEEITELAKFDAEYFGADRIKVLKGLYLDHPSLGFVSRVGSKIAGYIMCRRTENGYRVGPWVCSPENPHVARELLTRCMTTIRQSEKLYVGVPAVNKTTVEILREFGFEQYSKSIRMRFGKKLEKECIHGIFAIGGPEKG